MSETARRMKHLAKGLQAARSHRIERAPRRELVAEAERLGIPGAPYDCWRKREIADVIR